MEELVLPFEKIYVLSLVERPERLENFKKEVNSLGITNEIIPWYSCFHPYVGLIARNLKVNKKFEWNGEGNGNAFNCTREHYGIVKQALYRGIKSILVFEDDFQFTHNRDALVEFLKKPLPLEWNLIQYGYVLETGKFIESKGQEIVYTPITQEKHFWGTYCYALDQAGMKYYIDSLDSKYGVADLPLFEAYHSQINAWSASENICMNYGNFKTTIQDGRLKT